MGKATDARLGQPAPAEPCSSLDSLVGRFGSWVGLYLTEGLLLKVTLWAKITRVKSCL